MEEKKNEPQAVHVKPVPSNCTDDYHTEGNTFVNIKLTRTQKNDFEDSHIKIKSVLEQDEANRKGIPLFHCDTCSDIVIGKYQLEWHMDHHGITKKFECVYCNKLCTSSYYLKKHSTWVHTFPTAFSCKVCTNTWYINKIALDNHKDSKQSALTGVDNAAENGHEGELEENENKTTEIEPSTSRMKAYHIRVQNDGMDCVERHRVGTYFSNRVLKCNLCLITKVSTAEFKNHFTFMHSQKNKNHRYLKSHPKDNHETPSTPSVELNTGQNNQMQVHNERVKSYVVHTSSIEDLIPQAHGLHRDQGQYILYDGNVHHEQHTSRGPNIRQDYQVLDGKNKLRERYLQGLNIFYKLDVPEQLIVFLRQHKLNVPNVPNVSEEQHVPILTNARYCQNVPYGLNSPGGLYTHRGHQLQNGSYDRQVIRSTQPSNVQYLVHENCMTHRQYQPQSQTLSNRKNTGQGHLNPVGKNVQNTQNQYNCQYLPSDRTAPLVHQNQYNPIGSYGTYIHDLFDPLPPQISSHGQQHSNECILSYTGYSPHDQLFSIRENIDYWHLMDYHPDRRNVLDQQNELVGDGTKPPVRNSSRAIDIPKRQHRRFYQR